MEENKVIVHRFYEAINKHNLTLVDEFVAQDYVDHPRQFQGLENYKQHLTMHYTSFPDSHETIEDIIAEGDKVVARVTGIGTHQGEFMGIAPTGKKVTISYIRIFRIAKGKITEDWTGIRRSTQNLVAQLRG